MCVALAESQKIVNTTIGGYTGIWQMDVEVDAAPSPIPSLNFFLFYWLACHC
jgi:hypothetical protein